MRSSAPLCLLMAAAIATATNVTALAQDFPQRTITFICPFPAGGGTDILTRLLATELQDKLKQTVIVENRVGGGTVLAAQGVLRSPPDGYTIFLAPVTTLAIKALPALLVRKARKETREIRAMPGRKVNKA